MATINKALTTYLPPQSVEWLEEYCLDNEHLQNKEGNPKLGYHHGWSNYKVEEWGKPI